MPNCFYCYQPATTEDHIQPLSRGGSNAKSNKVPACKLCNVTKANVPQEDFIRFLNYVKDRGVEFHNVSKRVRRDMIKKFKEDTGILIGTLESTVPTKRAKDLKKRGEFAPNLQELQRQASTLNAHLLA